MSPIVAFLTRFAERVITLEGWRAALLAVAAGALSALALAPYHFIPVLFVTFPIFVWLLDGAVAPAGSHGAFGFFARFWPAFRTGWLFGFGYFLGGMWWIGKAFLVDTDEFIYFLPLAVLALPAGLALFWGGATALARIAWGPGWIRLVALAAALMMAEWARGTVLTGLPWNTLGYTMMPTPIFMQTSALMGVYGVTFFTVFLAATLGMFAPLSGEQTQQRKVIMVLSPLLLLAHGVYGLVTLSSASDDFHPDIRLRLVQPGLLQSEKWDPANEAMIMKRYLDLSNVNKGPQNAGVASFSHIIWPESAFPFILTQRRDQLAAIANLLPDTTQLITGAMRLESDDSIERKIFNALYVLNGQGEIIAAHDKTRLVPFGEFLPFQEVLENLGIQQLTNLRGGFASGNRRQVVQSPNTPNFLSLICYEIIFSGRVKTHVTQNEDGEEIKPQWIVNLTNDAWFGLTAGPYQHAHQAQVRAVEEGLPVVRAANSGISMVVDSYGRVLESLDLGLRGVVDSNLPMARPKTFFSAMGNLPFLIFVCILFGVLVVLTTTNTKRL